MSARFKHPDVYELVNNRPSIDSNDSLDLDDADYESQSLTRSIHLHHRPSFVQWLRSLLSGGIRDGTSIYPLKRIASPRKNRKRATCLLRPSIRRLCFILQAIIFITLALIIFTGLFRPSYTRLPEHYQSLRTRSLNSTTLGRGNPRNEKVFIAASIYDRGGKLARGAWGDGILRLIELLGPDNVYLSIYENGSGSEAENALRELGNKTSCNHSLVAEGRPVLNEILPITLPDGSKRIKRISYLAEVRNRALRPLDTDLDIQFDKLLYLNDIVFDPIDAAQLLFSTNILPDGRAGFRGACSVDFVNPFKFYDTFATRDLEGYSMGIPFFPWFSDAGDGISRRDVLQQQDAVRVRSCWGGMVAFDAKYFQQGSMIAGKVDTAEDSGVDRNLNWHWADPDLVPPVDRRATNSSVARFRAEKDLYWDASECCLIQADIQRTSSSTNDSEDVGIFMNPYVRVAYTTRTLSWLRFTRRFERLYSIPHNILNHMTGMPWYNPRRAEIPGEEVEEMAWVADERKDNGGSFEIIRRIAGKGGFCGRRNLQVMREDPKPGERNWETLPTPTI